MQKPTPPRRDFRQLEQRRQRAARLFADGKLSLAEIARELQVSRQSVSRWHAGWKKGGNGALRAAGRAGRKPKLNRQQCKQVERALRQGARAHGFPTDLWTLPRVGDSDRALNRRALSPRPRVEDPAGPGLEPATSGQTSPRAQSGESARWLTQTWPEIKKKLAAARPGYSSRTRAASHNVPPSAGPGLPKAKPRS